jgi:hypothetical protein
VGYHWQFHRTLRPVVGMHKGVLRALNVEARMKRSRVGVVAGAVLLLTTSGCSSTVATDQPGQLSQSEQAWIDDRLAEERDAILADHPGAEIPKVELVRLVDLLEWPGVFAGCLVDAGYDVEVTADGGIRAEIGAGQDLAYRLAKYTCNSMYPVDPAYEQPLSSDDLEALYDYQTGELTACLESRGWVVDRPPSLQVFMDSYGQAGFWHPYSNVDLGVGWEELNVECPQVPSGFLGG